MRGKGRGKTPLPKIVYGEIARIIICPAGRRCRASSVQAYNFSFWYKYQNSLCMLYLLFPTKDIRFCVDPGIATSLLVLQTSNAGQF